MIDLFNDQEYINADEFTPKLRKLAFSALRDIKKDIEVKIYESATGLDNYFFST